MKKINSLFLSFFISFFLCITIVSCQNEESIEVTKPLTQQDYVVNNGRLVFNNSAAYLKTYQMLSNFDQKQLNDWRMSIGIKTLQDVYDSKKIATNDSVDYEPVFSTGDQAKGMLPYMFNQEGVLQYSDTILVIKEDKMFSVSDGNENTVETIIKGKSISKIPNVIETKHTRTLKAEIKNPIGLQKASERTLVVNLTSRIRQFVQFEGNVVTINPPGMYEVRFDMTGYQQNKFAWWWAPTLSPLASGSIKFNGTAFGVDTGIYGQTNQYVNFNGGTIYNVEKLQAFRPAFFDWDGIPYVDITTTYTYDKNPSLKGVRVIHYVGNF